MLKNAATVAAAPQGHTSDSGVVQKTNSDPSLSGDIAQIRAVFKTELCPPIFCPPDVSIDAATVSVAPMHLHQTLVWFRRPIAKHPSNLRDKLL